MQKLKKVLKVFWQANKSQSFCECKQISFKTFKVLKCYYLNYLILQKELQCAVKIRSNIFLN